MLFWSNTKNNQVRERRISKKEIKEFIKNPDKVERSIKEPQKIFDKETGIEKRPPFTYYWGKENSILKIITVIDTSKISKYF